jgi:hypothetical protein
MLRYASARVNCSSHPTPDFDRQQCRKPFLLRLSNGSKIKSACCGCPSCSRECYTFWAIRLADELKHAFRKNPPTHTARVSAALTIKGYSVALAKLCRFLRKSGTEYWLIYHWHRGNAHVHLLLRNHAFPTRQLGAFWRQSIPPGTKSGLPYCRPVRHADGLVDYLLRTPASGKVPELPPEGVKRQMTSQSRGFLAAPADGASGGEQGAHLYLSGFYDQHELPNPALNPVYDSPATPSHPFPDDPCDDGFPPTYGPPADAVPF